VQSPADASSYNDKGDNPRRRSILAVNIKLAKMSEDDIGDRSAAIEHCFGLIFSYRMCPAFEGDYAIPWLS
jgi:hypothetical protein